MYNIIILCIFYFTYVLIYINLLGSLLFIYNNLNIINTFDNLFHSSNTTHLHIHVSAGQKKQKIYSRIFTLNTIEIWIWLLRWLYITRWATKIKSNFHALFSWVWQISLLIYKVLSFLNIFLELGDGGVQQFLFKAA